MLTLTLTLNLTLALALSERNALLWRPVNYNLGVNLPVKYMLYVMVHDVRYNGTVYITQYGRPCVQ